MTSRLIAVCFDANEPLRLARSRSHLGPEPSPGGMHGDFIIRLPAPAGGLISRAPIHRDAPVALASRTDSGWN
jgi:hypothetical protein